MAPQIEVMRNVGQTPGQHVWGPGSYTDLVASRARAEKPIAAGIWHLEDVTEPMPGMDAEWDEVKYVLEGEMTLRDETTGVEVTAYAGDMIWFPTGAKTTIVSSRNLSTVYVEQRHAEWATQTSEFEDNLQVRLGQLKRWYVEANPKSAAAFENAVKVLPGGNTRTVLYNSPFPLVLDSGVGTLVTSRDGTEYIDFVSEYSAAMYGHTHPKIYEAVQKSMSMGMNLGSISSLEADFAKLIQRRFPSMELLRFTNSGTEANTLAIAAALAFTSRKKVLVFRNGYHGSTMSFHGGANSPMNLPHDFIVGEYNEIQAVRPLLTHHIGAILVEPMQCAGGILPATRDFLEFLRSAASTFGAVLIFDEIVTSRLDYHGLQGYWDVKPDMTTLGKYIGGGFSFGCFGGRRDIMQQFDPRNEGHLAHSGTYNNNVFTMTAGIAGMELVTAKEIQRINGLGDRVRTGINDIFKRKAVQCVKAVGFGSAVGLRIEGSVGTFIKDAIYFALLQQGILIARRGFLMLNLLHTDALVDNFLTSFKIAIETIL